MNQGEQWRVQLWLGEHLIEEHIAPAALAEQYANVIRLRIRGLSGRRLHCERVTEHELAYPTSRPYDPRDCPQDGRNRHHTSRAE